MTPIRTLLQYANDLCTVCHSMGNLQLFHTMTTTNHQMEFISVATPSCENYCSGNFRSLRGASTQKHAPCAYWEYIMSMLSPMSLKHLMSLVCTIRAQFDIDDLLGFSIEMHQSVLVWQSLPSELADCTRLYDLDVPTLTTGIQNPKFPLRGLLDSLSHVDWASVQCQAVHKRSTGQVYCVHESRKRWYLRCDGQAQNKKEHQKTICNTLHIDIYTQHVTNINNVFGTFHLGSVYGYSFLGNRLLNLYDTVNKCGNQVRGNTCSYGWTCIMSSLVERRLCIIDVAWRRLLCRITGASPSTLRKYASTISYFWNNHLLMSQEKTQHTTSLHWEIAIRHSLLISLGPGWREESW